MKADKSQIRDDLLNLQFLVCLGGEFVAIHRAVVAGEIEIIRAADPSGKAFQRLILSGFRPNDDEPIAAQKIDRVDLGYAFGDRMGDLAAAGINSGMRKSARNEKTVKV